jgi:hypothetical protein
MDGMPGYWLTRMVLQRGLALVYLIAFLVAVNQFRPLCGEKGLLPAPQFIRTVPLRAAPSIFYFFPRDAAFALFGWLGVLLAILAVTGISERYGTWLSMTVWALLWVIYLSFVNIGQTFYGFGWESILLESGFLAIFLGAANTEPKLVMIWLFRWVLFRVILGAGMIKLRGDPCWRDLTCLDYHFETQPMPNPLSWYFHWLPGWVHKAGVLFNHLVEVVAPFFYFAPQPASAIAGILVVLFQGSLLVSGNFSWLSFLTLILAFSTFDDAQLGKLIPLGPPPLASPSPFHAAAIWGVALLVALLSVKPVRNLLSRDQVMNTSYNPFHLVNTYGAFGSITRERYEIVLEGTDETVVTASTHWREYGFKGKPGDPRRMPPQIAPYHLRLDWLMWFAAMPSPYYDPWFIHLLAKLLANDALTTALLKDNPFPAAPPSHVRALHYRYRFTTPEERRKSGCWWQRELAGTYFPPVSLTDPSFRALLKRLELPLS